MKYKLIVFDAYGTIFDIYSISNCLENIFPNQGAAISLMWRNKQIEYTRLVTMSHPSPMGSRYYLSFLEITIRSLRYVCKSMRLVLSEADERIIINQYNNLPAYAECAEVLKTLKQKGIATAILSNADKAMLSAEVNANGLKPYLDKILSTEDLKLFKTAPQTYDLVLQTFTYSKNEILFVSSNAWDVVGAGWFGFDVFWVNRVKLPFEEIGNQPNYVHNSLEGLLEVIA